MKVCELLNSMSPLHEIRIKRAYNDAILYRGIVKDAPTCTTERDVCNIYSTVVNRYEWNKKERRYNMLSVSDVTSELEIFVYD